MSPRLHGHKGRNGETKISYKTLEEAKLAARKRCVEWGRNIVAYRCGLTRKGIHYHIGNRTPKISPGARLHEEHNLTLGDRVVGCLIEESRPSRYASIMNRLRAAERRRG